MKEFPAAPVVLAITKAVVLGLALVWAGIASANPLIVGNNSSSANHASPGPITTYDFVGGNTVGSFVPDGAQGKGGRGIAIAGNEVFYAEVGAGGIDAIHVCPFNGGAGGADTRTLPNPRPSAGIQDLAFYGGSLYALTGYFLGASLQVFKLDPLTGGVLAGPITISVPVIATNGFSDGFTVLPSGNFLVNDDDTSLIYREYDSATGQPTGFSMVVPGASLSTGVDISPDGQSLYFATDFSSFTETDLAGNLLSKIVVRAEVVEDIAVLAGPASSPTNGCVQILCPTNIVVAGCTNTPLTYFVTVIDPCGSNTLVCTPPSGYAFPIGTTNVHCVATDVGSGQTTNCDFTVTVTQSNCISTVAIGPRDSDINVEWRMMIGHTAFVQAVNSLSGITITDAFTDIGGPIFVTADPWLFIPGDGYVRTNFYDAGVLTNHPARFYRIRLVL